MPVRPIFVTLELFFVAMHTETVDIFVSVRLSMSNFLIVPAGIISLATIWQTQ
jgi:hypothetical protein